MGIIITRISAFIAALSVWFGVIFCPQTTEGVFTDKQEGITQTEFDEGEFVMVEVIGVNDYDLIGKMI